MSTHAIYRTLTILYPKEFRDRYGDDLVQNHADLTADRGPAAAWARTGLDLIVTIPRYHLETIMSQRHTTTSLNATIALLAIAGIAGLFTVGYPSLALVGMASIIAVSQRSRIAHAIREPDTDRRHRRLITAAVLSFVSIAAVVVALADLGGDDHWDNGRLIAYNLVFIASAVGAIASLLTGLLTPKAQPRQPAN